MNHAWSRGCCIKPQKKEERRKLTAMAAALLSKTCNPSLTFDFLISLRSSNRILTALGFVMSSAALLPSSFRKQGCQKLKRRKGKKKKKETFQAAGVRFQ
jgi:hypothetical protein